jgi:hypothetical protein
MFPPIDPTRRKGATPTLRIVAGTTALAGADPYELFLKQHDPAFLGVNAHRQAARIHSEAVKIQFASHGKVTRAARLTETTSEACGDQFSAARALVKTPPPTMLGVIALLQYLATLFDDEGSGVDCSSMPGQYRR